MRHYPLKMPLKKQRNEPSPPRISESDISDTLEDESAPNSPEALEAIDGVQPELQRTPKESEINKMCLIVEYLGGDRTRNIDEILGPLPLTKTLFRNKHYLLTCTIGVRNIDKPIYGLRNGDDLAQKGKEFTNLPFNKEHLKRQIESAGGMVYNHFENVPKNKYKQCRVIAPYPCATAKFVQCLAADIKAVSHEWIIECCRQNNLVDVKKYYLPSGWSLIEERYIKWQVGRTNFNRASVSSFSGTKLLISSLHLDFIEFWSRVCKLAGGTVGIIKSQADITNTTKGYMLYDCDFPSEIIAKANHFGIPLVSTVWAVQCLIMGKVCHPSAHKRMTECFQDDDDF